MKIAEAIGKSLDWAVGMALDPGHAQTLWRLMKNKRWTPSTDWSQGGPIIGEHCLSLRFNEADDFGEPWVAKNNSCEYHNRATGPTPLIAAMRCFVISKLGSVVDVPKEFP